MNAQKIVSVSLFFDFHRVVEVSRIFAVDCDYKPVRKVKSVYKLIIGDFLRNFGNFRFNRFGEIFLEFIGFYNRLFLCCKFKPLT